MRTKHIFASAAIAAVLVANVPAEAQLLGGGARGGVTGMQGATFGGGFGPLHGAMSEQASASTAGRAGIHAPGTERVNTAAKAGEHSAVRGVETVKGKMEATSRSAVRTGVSDADQAQRGAKATTAATANSFGPSSLTATGQGGVQVGQLSTGSDLAGGFSGQEAQTTPAGASNDSKPASTQKSPAHGAARSDTGGSASRQSSTSR